MNSKRIARLNSLLKEVLSEVISREVKNPLVSKLVSVTQVDISSDLHHAKVYISVIDSEEKKTQTLQALQKAAGFISTQAAKKVVLRFFPSLTFFLDRSAEQHIKIEKILKEIEEEKKHRS